MDSVNNIPLANLAIAFIPALIVVWVMYRWSLKAGNALYGMGRMLLQLLLVGYLLAYIFEAEHAGVVVAVLVVMLLSSSVIALRNIKGSRWRLFKVVLMAVTVGGVSTLAVVSQAVLDLNPWFMPQYLIPLAGMVFANAMNSVSLAAERMQSEVDDGKDYEKARNTAFNASLIPITNSLFAVGLVSLPGMMTGQILSGVSPLIAARYQIMVMCMTFASAGISSACFLWLARKQFNAPPNPENQS